MRKITFALILAVAGYFLAGPLFARVTGSSPADRDIFCVGPSGAEVCVDSSGNMIPTTDDDTDLGTSSLQWQDLYLDGTAYVDALSNEGAYTGTTGAFTSTLDVDGNVTIGAGGYVSTFTAASGNLDITGAVDIDGAVTLNSTLDVDGNEYHGAAAYRSTFTAASGAQTWTGAITSLGAVTGASVVASGGAMRLYSRTKAQILAIAAPAIGDAYYCSDCTAVTLCVSTATAGPAFVKVDDKSAACD